jgi:hypothetical protein
LAKIANTTDMVTRSSSLKTSADGKKSIAATSIAAVAAAATNASGPQPNGSSSASFVPKTDKPRPHKCGTCERTFARLEHLKRHERSHTKEKPFGCPECQRCFARRDLLLRHQQKLHASAASSARSRARRDSTSATMGPANRVRKNSVASTAQPAGAMRPRANTISHTGGLSSAQMAASTQAARANPISHVRHPSLSGLPHTDHSYAPMAGMAAAMHQRAMTHQLPKLDTHGIHAAPYIDNMALRTAPALGFYNYGAQENFFPTINPNALHYSESAAAHLPFDLMGAFSTSNFGDPASTFGDLSATTFEDSPEWVSSVFDSHMSFGNRRERSASSSVSSMSKDSGLSDLMLDGSNQHHNGTPSLWSTSSMMSHPHMASFSLGMHSPSLDMLAPHTLSPQVSDPQPATEPFPSPVPAVLATIDPSVPAQAKMRMPAQYARVDTPSRLA